MQRTIHGTNIFYGVVQRDENGNVWMENRVYKSTEKDENKAKKEFRKHHTDEAIFACEPFSDLYILDDEIFFKYAKVAEKTENTATDTTENPETDDQ